jgi:hypothetical protein
MERYGSPGNKGSFVSFITNNYQEIIRRSQRIDDLRGEGE